MPDKKDMSAFAACSPENTISTDSLDPGVTCASYLHLLAHATAETAFHSAVFSHDQHQLVEFIKHTCLQNNIPVQLYDAGSIDLELVFEGHGSGASGPAVSSRDPYTEGEPPVHIIYNIGTACPDETEQVAQALTHDRYPTGDAHHPSPHINGTFICVDTAPTIDTDPEALPPVLPSQTTVGPRLLAAVENIATAPVTPQPVQTAGDATQSGLRPVSISTAHEISTPPTIDSSLASFIATQVKFEELKQQTAPDWPTASTGGIYTECQLIAYLHHAAQALAAGTGAKHVTTAHATAALDIVSQLSQRLTFTAKEPATRNGQPQSPSNPADPTSDYFFSL